LKTIALTQGKTALVDDEDYNKISHFPWFAIRQRKHWYAVYATGPATARVHHRMHTVLMKPPSGMEVDHINGDGLNNTRANMRIVRPADNAKNRRKGTGKGGRPTTSQYKGVNFYPLRSCWLARIMVDKRSIHIGYFASEEAAARAYDQAAAQHHGEFARLNFP
jgi:hypothetical protein